MIRTASSACCRPGNQRRRSSFLICTLRVVAAVPAQISSHGIARMNLRKGPHQPAQADGALVGASRGQGARCRRSLGAGELVRSVAYARGLGRTRPFTRESAHGERCRSARVVLPAGALGASRNIGAVVGRPQPRHNQHRHLRALGQPQWLCVSCHIPPDLDWQQPLPADVAAALPATQRAGAVPSQSPAYRSAPACAEPSARARRCRHSVRAARQHRRRAG